MVKRRSANRKGYRHLSPARLLLIGLILTLPGCSEGNEESTSGSAVSSAKAAEKAGTRQQVEPASSWRHTFGSERRTARWRELAEAGFAADIVALQGVTSAGDARRLVPARRYHVVVSRQLLARSNAGSTGSAVFRNDAPETTALAFRRQDAAPDRNIP